MEAELSDDELHHLWALSLVDDWGGEWKRTAAICAEVHNASIRIVQALAAAHKLKFDKPLEFKDSGDFEPVFAWEKAAREYRKFEQMFQTAEQQFDALRR